MLDKIISSKSRLEVLNVLYNKPDKEFFPQEIAKKSKQDPANVYKEIQSLVDARLLIEVDKDQKRAVCVDKNNPYFNALSSLFLEYKKQLEREKLFKLVQMPNYYPMFCLPTVGSLPDIEKFFKRFSIKNRYKECYIHFKDNMCTFYMQKKEFFSLSSEIVEKLTSDYDWAKNYVKELKEQEKIVFEETSKLLKINLVELDNLGLKAVFEKYFKIYEDLIIFHWVQTCADFDDNLFSKYLLNYLEEKTKKKGLSIGEVFSVLTTPFEEGLPMKEYKDLIKILQYINESDSLKKYFSTTETRIIASAISKVDSKLHEMLKNHVDSYGWIGYGTVGPGWKINYFIDILASLIRQKSNPEEMLKKLEDDRELVAKKCAEYIKSLDIDEHHQKVFEVARDIVFTKGSRKEIMFFNLSAMENLYREIGRRFYLSLNQVRFMYPFEIHDLLSGGLVDSQLINQRIQNSVYIPRGDYKDAEVVYGEDAQKLIDSLDVVEEDVSNLKELNGDCAAPGRARGRARIVNVVSEMDKVEEGDILISIATMPDLMPAIKKSVAIVTDSGGITCHAAIVARELGIPCVIGTKFATKILKDGQLIDIDASHGKVIIID